MRMVAMFSSTQHACRLVGTGSWRGSVVPNPRGRPTVRDEAPARGVAPHGWAKPADGARSQRQASTLLREARAMTPDDPGRALGLLETSADRVLRRAVLWLGLLGAVLILLFWGGY